MKSPGMQSTRDFILMLSGCVFFVSTHASMNSGAEIYNEFLEKGLVYPDQEWQKYVTEVGERPVSYTHLTLPTKRIV